MQGRGILGPMVAASLVGLAAVTGVLAAPAPSAQAAVAACPGSTGVTVIVDYNEIGGPTRAGCDADGGGQSAAQVFPGAGFTLEYEPRQPGYVCKVTGLPTDRPCLEDDSFWSLWWSDGKSGRWAFSNQGVSGLSVPDGGYVAFAWHEGGGRAEAPDVVPTAHQSTQNPSQQPSHTSGGHDGGSTSSAGGGTTTAAPTTATTATSAPATSSGAAAPLSKASKSDRASDATTATQTGSSTVPGAAEITAGPPGSDLATESDADDGGSLPTWIGLGLAAGVLGAAGLVVLLRRRERGGPPA